jgi:hypothetical protein
MGLGEKEDGGVGAVVCGPSSSRRWPESTGDGGGDKGDLEMRGDGMVCGWNERNGM